MKSFDISVYLNFKIGILISVHTIKCFAVETWDYKEIRVDLC